jgi:hypothetical protein
MTICHPSTGKTLIETVGRHAYSLSIQKQDAPDEDKTEVWENANFCAETGEAKHKHSVRFILSHVVKAVAK